MARETASLAPFHWFRPTEGSLDSQPILSRQPTGVCSAAGSYFPLRLMGSPPSGAALYPHCHSRLRTFALKHRRLEQRDLIKACWGQEPCPGPHPLQVSAGEPAKGKNKQVELVGVGTVGLKWRANPDGETLIPSFPQAMIIQVVHPKPYGAFSILCL